MANQGVVCGMCREKYPWGNFPEDPLQCPQCADKNIDEESLDVLYFIEIGEIDLLLDVIKKGKTDFLGNLASINYRDVSGNTPLSRSSANGHLNMVETLVEMGADIHATNNKGFDALMFASREGRYEIFKKLVYLGANINHVTKDGKSWRTVLFDKRKEKELDEYIQDLISANIKPGKK